MRAKLLFVTGAAVGYVLGAKAGRKRYEQIKAAATRAWETPIVQNQVNAVEDFAAEKFGELPGALFGGAKKVVTRVVNRAQTAQRQSVSYSTPVRPGAPASTAGAPPPSRTSTSSVTIAAPPDDETAKPPKGAKRTATPADRIDEADDAGA